MASNSFSAFSGNLPASVSLVAFTMIMKRIELSLVSIGSHFGFLSGRRSSGHRIDRCFDRIRLFFGDPLQVLEAGLKIRADHLVQVDEHAHYLADEGTG